MILSSPSSSLIVSLTGSTVTSNPFCFIDYVDITPTTFVPQLSAVQLNGTSSVTLLSGNDSIQRSIKNLKYYNADSIQNTVVFSYVLPTIGTASILRTAVPAGGTIKYSYDGGWAIADATGDSLESHNIPGRLLRVNYVTGGSSYIFGTDCNRVRLKMLGGGAAGAGAVLTNGPSASIGSGGSSGVYIETFFTIMPRMTASLSVGAGGTGVAGQVGNNGGNTTFTLGGQTTTALGGLSGQISTTSTGTVGVRAAAITAVTGTTRDINGAASPGYPALFLSGTGGPVVFSGQGGFTLYGAGGRALLTTGTGLSGSGFGSGGSGAVSIAGAPATAPAGGAGRQGIIIIEEYT